MTWGGSRGVVGEVGVVGVVSRWGVVKGGRGGGVVEDTKTKWEGNVAPLPCRASP